MKQTNLGKEFSERWQRINAFQLEEQRRLTPEERLRQGGTRGAENTENVVALLSELLSDGQKE